MADLVPPVPNSPPEPRTAAKSGSGGILKLSRLRSDLDASARLGDAAVATAIAASVGSADVAT